ncbi:MAG: AAA family ATPase [Gammaproteobacteria bacterium]|nr:AAA family ATPase [Gammaproteobacteria bacterium]
MNMDKGAHFHRCDFQVHSPRDEGWHGIRAVSDEDRREYAARFIAACRSRALDAVAITDHHDLVFVRYIREAAKSEQDNEGNLIPAHDQIVVFPGIELTLSVPCQALLIFDADFPDDMFGLALTALAIEPRDPSEPTTAPVVRLEHITTLNSLKEELDKHAFLRGRYIILPNVSDGGADTLIRKGAASKYKSMPCVGGYIDGSIDNLGQGNRDIINGKASEYGNKRIALFQTSDSRRNDHRHLGTVSTWTKWAVPTAEALRQACLAQESRVSQTPPRLPAVVIESISVGNSKFLGPFDLNFNSQYNALIGGRGTGKSTVLEYLRWALCDQPPPPEEDNESPNYAARRRRLITHTLEPLGAAVEVRFISNEVPHVVRRDSTTGEILMKIGSNDLEPCSEEDVRRLFPIQAYSQKQLSDVSVRIEELSRFVAGPIRSRLDNILEQISEVAAQVRESYSMVLRQRALSRMLETRELGEKSLSEQVETLRSGLEGLSDDDRALLNRGRLYARADQVVDSWRTGLDSFRLDAERLRRTAQTQLSSIQSPTELPEEQLLTAALEQYQSLLSDAVAALDSHISRIDDMIVSPDNLGTDSPWRSWYDKRKEFQKAYDAAVQRSSSHQERMEQLNALDESLQGRVRETARIRQELQNLEGVKSTYDTLRIRWQNLICEHDDALDEQCAKLTIDSGHAIRAYVQRFSNTGDFVASLKQAISGSRIPGSKIDALGTAISGCDTVEAARTLCANLLAELERLADYDAEKDGTQDRPAAPTLKSLGFTSANLDGIGRSLNLEEWLTLSLTPIISEPVFEFRAREKEYIPFQSASAGQQATALLKTLLNQDGPPLIVDQPEEDLDNPVILEIVESVWQAKQKRQLIFASHNANLVVNGDAELVAWCDHRTAVDQSRGTIAGKGAIDVDEVREAIKKIMEGGEAAFNLRKEKYGF